MKKTLLLAGCACALAAALSGCTTMNASNLNGTISALAAAGCSGAMSNEIIATTAAGMSPGSFSLKHTFTGTCDPSKAIRTAAAPAPVAAPPASPAAAATPAN